ncbi:SWPV1-214 [Shearwaterpox virus]|uniref:SWPV1-214 n=1 Tax=Shearwaterpox virus TaxID=1974596 RepID=A0A1V0S833_CNPV|nr:SWPV1-214 [Shearwaterpox virus]
MENFHRDFINRIKRSTVNDPSIFTEKEELKEQETLADNDSMDDRSIQSRIVSFFKNNNSDGLFNNFLQKIDDTQQFPRETPHSSTPVMPSTSQSGINGTSSSMQQPTASTSTSNTSTTLQPISANVVNDPSPIQAVTSVVQAPVAPNISVIQPPQQIPLTPVGQAARNLIGDIPTWITNIYDKYQDRLHNITVPANNIDRAGREMLFDEILLWIKYALDEENIVFPHDLRELRDVIIPPPSN